MAFLEMHGVYKGYGPPGTRTEVLDNINLEIDQGEFVAIVGYSGAGKTSLVSMIAGLLQPDRGTVRLEGKEIREPGPDRGVVFQTYSLLPWKSVYGNIYLAVDRVFSHWSQAQKDEHTRRYIAMVNLTPASRKKPGELSGGMRQRVALARALAIEPRVLLMDEPLSALDALTRATLQDEIVRIWSQDQRTVVMITNDVDEGILLADRIIPLSRGPRATLGAPVAVDLPRPRDRKAVNHDPRFQKIRNQVIGYLLQSAERPQRSTRSLSSPVRRPHPVEASV
jgi:nitrate/nitrite transport system ATP-binding protein